MKEARFRGYDYSVMGLFAFVLVGVSLSWYSVSVSFESQKLSAGSSGWHYAWGVLAFVAALLAIIMVGVKASVVPGGRLPIWYKQGPIIMGLGDLIVVFAIIGFIDKPGRGVDVLGLVDINYAAGLYLTLVAGLLLGACGVLAFRDRPAPAPGTTAAPGSPAPPFGGGVGSWQAGPWQGAACPACGTQLEPGSRFCRSCGRPQA